MGDEREPWFSDRGSRLTIVVEDGYLKAYAQPINDDGTEGGNGYGLQGRPREQVSEGVRSLVNEFLAAAENSQESPS